MAVTANRVKNGTSTRVRRQHIDFWLFITILILLSIGTVMVFSSSAAYAHERFGDTYYFLKKQLVWVLAGLIAMFVMANVDYRIWAKLSPLILAGSLGLLILATIPGIGKVQNGARRWLGFGSLSFQPSEMVKIALILFLAHSLSNRSKSLNSFVKGFIPYVILAGGISGILVLQPHVSAAMLIVSVTAIMMIIAGCDIKHFVLMAVPVLGAAVVIATKMEHVAKRVLSFMDPFSHSSREGYQVIQSLFAIASGGLFGKGLGKSLQKYLYLPEPYNDFILAILAEELGFVGVLAVMFLFGMFIWRGYKVASHAPDKFGSLVAAGITSLIAVQLVINVAVVTSSMPVTGMPLPFFSYGGTSLVFLMGSMGILLNISRYSKYDRF